jgi:hypothetical protein
MKKLKKKQQHQRKRKWLESSRRLRGFGKNMNPSWEGRLQLNASKLTRKYQQGASKARRDAIQPGYPPSARAWSSTAISTA